MGGGEGGSGHWRLPAQPYHPSSPHCQLLENMYNMSFRAYNRTLQFDTSGNVDLAYDLKLWVWRDQMPTLRTVGSYNGSLELQFYNMVWHTPGNQVSNSRVWGGGAAPRAWASTASHAEPEPCRPPGACVPVLTAVQGGPGAPREGLPLLLLRLCGLQGGQLPAPPR